MLDVTQTLMLAEPSDKARARGIVCGYATDKNTFLAEAHIDDSTLTIELAAIENSIGHSGNEIDDPHEEHDRYTNRNHTLSDSFCFCRQR